MLNLDVLFGKKIDTRNGITARPPEKGAARFFFLTYTHFAKLVGLNMLFLMFCIPVITIPAALSGLNRTCILLVREGTCSAWYDFIKEFKVSFLRSIPLGTLCAFVFADAALCIYLGQSVISDTAAMLLLIAAFILCVTAILMGSYIFVLLPLISLKNRDVLRDTVLLILLETKTNLLLLLVVGGGIAAAMLFVPYSVPVIAVIGFSFLSLATCTILNEPIQSRIIDQIQH